MGNALSSHPLVDMISFTGSTSGGVTVGKKALESVKHISLELGGKSPYVILPAKDHDYTEPIHLCFNSIFLNSGQTCTAFSRLLIPAEEKETIEKQLAEIAKEYTVGSPESHEVKLGPVSSLQQYKKISEYIRKGMDEGARLLLGGLPDSPDKGYYIKPTIFTDVKNDMTIAQDEIFGPVLCVITYRDEDDAISIANDVRYGLNAGVYGPKDKAIAMAHRTQAAMYTSMPAPVIRQLPSAATRKAASAGKAAFTACSNLPSRRPSSIQENSLFPHRTSPSGAMLLS